MAIHKIVINNVLNFAALNNTWITTVRRTADPQTAPANQTGEGDSDTLVFDEHNYAVVAAEGTVPKKFDTRFVYDFEVPIIYAKTQIHATVGNQSGATIPAVDFRIFYTMKKVGARELAQYLAQ